MDETRVLSSSERLGKYKVLSKLGAGGMADVYLAEDTDLDRKVALKVLPPNFTRDDEFLTRFTKEVKASATLNHDNIVRVYDVGQDHGVHYYTMELLEGGDLKEKIEKGISEDEALSIAQAIASALGHAHEKGFVHRDLKPQNILFTDYGKAVLTDLGIVKAMDGGTQLTETGASIGTPHYMSPEQGRGRELDGRSDLYALGIVIFEMLSGKVPFSNGDTFAIIFSHIHDPVPDLPNGLQKYQPLLSKLLAKDPNDRYADAAQLLSALAVLRQGPTAERTLDKTVKIEAAEATHKPRWFAGAFVVILILVGSGGWFGYQSYLHTVEQTRLAEVKAQQKADALRIEREKAAEKRRMEVLQVKTLANQKEKEQRDEKARQKKISMEAIAVQKAQEKKASELKRERLAAVAAEKKHEEELARLETDRIAAIEDGKRRKAKEEQAKLRAKGAQLPVWKVGDEWWYKGIAASVTSEIHQQVTGEGLHNGKPVYITRHKDKSNSYDTTSVNYYDKSTLNGVRMAMTLSGKQYISDWHFVATEGQAWPKFTGNKWQEQSTYTSPRTKTTTNTNFEVVGMENITTSLGTFKCYKIKATRSNFDAGFDIEETFWYNDGVKNFVKTEAITRWHEGKKKPMRADTTQITELTSYRITP